MRIRIAGAGGGGFQSAGEAATAYREAAASGQRVLERVMGMEVQAAQERERLTFAREREARIQEDQDRALEISERQQARLEREAFGAPLTGAGAFEMFRELDEIDTERAGALHRQISEILGPSLGGRALTPELLEAHPRFREVYASIAQARTDARTSRREASIEDTFEASIRSLRSDYGDVLEDVELQKFEADLALQLADPKIGAKKAAALARGVRAEAVALATDRRNRNSLAEEAAQFIDANAAALKSKRGRDRVTAYERAALMIGDIRTADDPEAVLADIMVLGGGMPAKIAERARFLGFREGAAGALAPTNENSEPTAGPELPSPTPDTIAFGELPGLEEAIGLKPSDPFMETLAQDLQAAGIAITDKDQVAAYIKSRIADGPDFSALYASKFMEPWAVKAMTDSIIGEG